MDICECGHCGQVVRPGRRFVKGHGNRARGTHFAVLVGRTPRRPAEGCWEANGSGSREGYVSIRVVGVIRFAHRVAWEDAVGPVPPGYVVAHVCDNPRCWRNDGPEGVYVVNGVEYRRFGHLWLGTHRANHLDMIAKGRGNPARGERHSWHTQPERMRAGIRYGDEHWTRRHPELARQHAAAHLNSKPSPSGDQHWRRLDPAKAVAADAKMSAKAKARRDTT